MMSADGMVSKFSGGRFAQAAAIFRKATPELAGHDAGQPTQPTQPTSSSHFIALTLCHRHGGA
jgi:hypothetical protein